MKEEYQDRIDDYMMGRMSQEDRLVFEKDIDTNPELKEQFEFIIRVQIAIKRRSEMLAKMQEWKDDYHWGDEENDERSAVCACPAREPEIKPKSIRRFLYVASGIAAVLVVGFLLFQNLYVMQSPPQGLPTHNTESGQQHNPNEGQGNHTDAIGSEVNMLPSDMKTKNPTSNSQSEKEMIRSDSVNSEIEELIRQRKYSEALHAIYEKIHSLEMDSTSIVLDDNIGIVEKEYQLLLIHHHIEELKRLRRELMDAKFR